MRYENSVETDLKNGGIKYHELPRSSLNQWQGGRMREPLREAPAWRRSSASLLQFLVTLFASVWANWASRSAIRFCSPSITGAICCLENLG